MNPLCVKYYLGSKLNFVVMQIHILVGSQIMHDNTCYLELRDACVVGSARVHYQSETRERWGRGRGLALV